MSYFTQQQILNEAARAGGNTSFSAGTSQVLSPKSARVVRRVPEPRLHGCRLILGVKAVLETMNLTVYVDWLDDPQLDRGKVTSSTAERLRQHCGSRSL